MITEIFSFPILYGENVMGNVHAPATREMKRFSTDRFKAVPLLQFFFVCASVCLFFILCPRKAVNIGVALITHMPNMSKEIFTIKAH